MAINEIALPTHAQVQAILDNQLNDMEFIGGFTSRVWATSEGTADIVLDVTGSGVFTFIGMTSTETYETSISIYADGWGQGTYKLGGKLDSSMSVFIPFKNSLQIEGWHYGDANTEVIYQYFLK